MSREQNSEVPTHVVLVDFEEYIDIVVICDGLELVRRVPEVSALLEPTKT